MPDIGGAPSMTEVWDYQRTVDGFDFELAHITQPMPIPLGIRSLDMALGGGIPVGTFTVVGGEGGTGKSALACMAAYVAARAGRFPVFFSMEMPTQMVVNRMLSIHSTVRVSRGEWPHDRLVWWSSTGSEVSKRMGGAGPRADMLRLGETERYMAAQRYMSEHGDDDVVLACWNDFKATIWPRIVVRDSVRTISEAISVVDAMCESGLQPFPIIDYLQLGADGDGKEYENITNASHALALCCKRHMLAMLVLSSLRNINKQERGDDPQQSWFRGSGQIGYDAGTAIVLMRADEEQEQGGRRVTAHIVKNRVGRTGDSVTLRFNGARNLIE